jgi:hypothetical protein
VQESVHETKQATKAGGNAGFFVGTSLCPFRGIFLDLPGCLNLPALPPDQNRQRFLGPELSVTITLQSTVGGFSSEFMRRLPDLEQAMVAHGLEPSQFVISKDWATPASTPLPALLPFFYNYTVFIGDENFTVTEPNDTRFLDYFYQRCIAEDEAAPETQRPRRPGLISRIFSWMAQPI